MYRGVLPRIGGLKRYSAHEAAPCSLAGSVWSSPRCAWLPATLPGASYCGRLSDSSRCEQDHGYPACEKLSESLCIRRVRTCAKCATRDHGVCVRGAESDANRAGACAVAVCDGDGHAASLEPAPLVRLPCQISQQVPDPCPHRREDVPRRYHGELSTRGRPPGDVDA
jgi:hypothetical protein